MSKRSKGKKRRRRGKQARNAPSPETVASSSPTEPALEELPSPPPPLVEEASPPAPAAPSSVDDDMGEDLELGQDDDMDISQGPRDFNLRDLNMAPRQAEQDRAQPGDVFESASTPPDEEDEDQSVDRNEEDPGGLVDFLTEVKTPAKNHQPRHDFLPKEELVRPKYLPDTLPGDALSPSSVEEESIWGKQEVDAPSFTKFDDETAIKEDIRLVPVLGKTLMSPTLVFRERAWKYAGVAGLAILFGGGLYTVASWVRDYRESGQAPMARELGLYEPAVIKNVDELLDRYFEAKSIEEKLPFLRAARHVHPLIVAHEAEYGPDGIVGYTRNQIKAPAPYMGKSFFTVDVNLKPSLESRRLVVERSDDGSYRLDWETMVGYQDQSWETLFNEKPSEPKTFRAVVLPSDYYNYAFSERKEWVSWKIAHPIYPELLLFGYTPRKSALTKQFTSETVARLGGPDKGTAVTLRLKYPENHGSEESNQVEIVEVLRRGWITPYPSE